MLNLLVKGGGRDLMEALEMYLMLCLQWLTLCYLKLPNLFSIEFFLLQTKLRSITLLYSYIFIIPWSYSKITFEILIFN